MGDRHALDMMKENKDQSQELPSLPLLEDMSYDAALPLSAGIPGALEVLVVCPGSIFGDAGSGLHAC